MIFMFFMVNIRKEYNHEDKKSMKKGEPRISRMKRKRGVMECWNHGILDLVLFNYIIPFFQYSNSSKSLVYSLKSQACLYAAH